MRRAIVVAFAFALVLVSATPALAHVTIDPGEVTEGGFTKLTFRVPNESDTASTTSLEVVLPEAAPFRSVSVRPTPGWTVAVERNADTVTGITWSGGEIKPGAFEEFAISVGPVPDVDVLEFKALQTYSDGEVVRWIDPVDGAEEPEHPAPTANVVDGDGGGEHGEEATSRGDDSGADGTDPAAFAALLLAGLALIAAVAAAIFATRRAPA